MEENNQSAKALNTMSGYSFSIETRTSEGKPLSTAVRMYWECAPEISGEMQDKISEQFSEFCKGVEDLF